MDETTGNGNCRETAQRSNSPFAGAARGHEPRNDDVGRNAQAVAESEQRDQRGLPPAALEQRDERLIELAFECQLRLGKASLFPELLEQISERCSEPVPLIHAAQHGRCARGLQRL